MTERDPESSVPGPTLDDSPPSTGLPAVDAALAPLGDLRERPLAEHHDALASAHEALHGELQSPPAYEP